MRGTIAAIVLMELRKGQQTTHQLRDAVVRSGLPRSQHMYSVLRNSILEPLAACGVISLVRETDPGEGGGIWELTD